MASFDYYLSITGDCSNTNNGIINLSLVGGTPPYTVQWQSPLTQVDIVASGASSIVTGLSASTYTARVNDSTLPTNQEFYINVPISSGVCASIVSVGAGTTSTCLRFEYSAPSTRRMVANGWFHAHHVHIALVGAHLSSRSSIRFGYTRSVGLCCSHLVVSCVWFFPPRHDGQLV